MGWLHWLLWPLFVLTVLIVVFYAFSLVANVIAAPFNSLLAERVGKMIAPRAQAGGAGCGTGCDGCSSH